MRNNQLIVGLGTGRCGTVSLAKLLNRQDKSMVSHEAKPLMPWDKRQLEGYQFHTNNFRKYLQNNSLVGDVASYWLPYVDNLFKDFNNAKIIGLWRNKQEMIKSFMKKTEGMNHWVNHGGFKWRKNIFDFCYPKYEANTKEEALEKYWEEYKRILKQKQKEYPNRILLLNVEELNNKKGQDKIFDFLRLDDHKHILPCKFNSSKTVWVSVLNTGKIRPEIANVLLKMSNDGRFALHVNYPNRRPEVANRNAIVKEFMASGYDYLLMIDSDTVPRNNPLDLVELEKDIINFAVPQWHENDLYWVAMKAVEDSWKQLPVSKRKGLQQVDATGLACILIHRRVFKAMEKPYFKSRYDKAGINRTSLDFLFCKEAKKLGFKVYVHFNYIASHFKEIDLLKVARLLGENNGG